MKLTNLTPQQLAATAVLLALMVPLLASLTVHCAEGMALGDGGSNGATHRCAGLWSATCCDFAGPSRVTTSVPGGFDAATVAFQGLLVDTISFAPNSFGVSFAAELPPGDRAGPPPPLELSSVLRF